MSNRNAATLHRRLDAGFAESLARDGGELVEHCGALLPPRLRRQDMRTMDRPRQPKVLLIQLAERTSGQGRRYFAGWLGKARLVGFLAEETDRDGNPLWNIYAAEPGQGGGRWTVPGRGEQK
jgi:hypothetical protein